MRCAPVAIRVAVEDDLNALVPAVELEGTVTDARFAPEVRCVELFRRLAAEDMAGHDVNAGPDQREGRVDLARLELHRVLVECFDAGQVVGDLTPVDGVRS